MEINSHKANPHNPLEFFDYIFSNVGQRDLIRLFVTTINQNEYYIDDEKNQETYYINIEEVLLNENQHPIIDENIYQDLKSLYRTFLKKRIYFEKEDYKKNLKARLTGVNNPQDENYVHNKLIDKLKGYNLIIETINPFPFKNAFQKWANKAIEEFPKPTKVNPKKENVKPTDNEIREIIKKLISNEILVDGSDTNNVFEFITIGNSREIIKINKPIYVLKLIIDELQERDLLKDKSLEILLSNNFFCKKSKKIDAHSVSESYSEANKKNTKPFIELYTLINSIISPVIQNPDIILPKP
jgi:hypothetical protein